MAGELHSDVLLDGSFLDHKQSEVLSLDSVVHALAEEQRAVQKGRVRAETGIWSADILWRLYDFGISYCPTEPNSFGALLAEVLAKDRLQHSQLDLILASYELDHTNEIKINFWIESLKLRRPQEPTS